MTGPKIAYQHFCPAARALEVIGEKWSLLIVRDLLAGPRRFSDLRRSLAAITPKWLSLRLQELEAAGIVEREQASPREVWYHLTPKGRSLAPILNDLVVWGVEHALRPPRPGEAVHPGRATDAFITYLNQRHVRPSRQVAWAVHFPGDRTYLIRFNGAGWSRERVEDATEDVDVRVDTTPEAWVAFLTSAPEERRRWLAESGAEGSADNLDELACVLGRPDPVADHDSVPPTSARGT